MARKMKDSGVEWIREIPDNWSVIKLKYLLSSNLQYGANESGIGFEKYLSRYVRITDITSDGKLKDDGKLSLSDEAAEGYILEDGDLLFARSGASVGKTFLYSEKYGKCAFAGYLIRAKIGKLMSPEYLKMFTCSEGYDMWVKSICVQSTIQNIGADRYSNLIVSIPNSMQEQYKVVKFLTQKIAQINRVIQETKCVIDDYKKYRESEITECVTYGKNDTKDCKESGITWIGKIPKSWELRKFKGIMKERNEKNNPIVSQERLSLSIDKGVTLYSEKTTNLDRFKDDFTQYKLAYEGDLVFNSMNMIVGAVGYSKYFGCVSPAYYTYYDEIEDHVTSKYYQYVFLCKPMRKILFSLGRGIMAIDRGDDKINTCRLKVSRDDLRSLLLPYPPIQEQRKIVNYLDNKCNEINKIIEEKEQLIVELEAYKKSFIYEYVTGKKEVPTENVR